MPTRSATRSRPRDRARDVVVRPDVLAPSAVGVLVRLQPADRGLHRRRVRGESVGSQRGHRRARAVDVVHAPSPEPRTIGLLLLLEPRHAGGESPRVGRGLGRQHLEHVGGDVGARWVRHLAEIAERETGAGAAGVVDVEGGPPAVVALHAFHPAHRPCDGGVDPGGVGMLDAPERQDDLCGVVDVGVVRRWRTRTPTRRVRAADGAPTSRRPPAPRAGAGSRPPARGPGRRAARRRRRARRPRARCPTPATGTPRGADRGRRRSRTPRGRPGRRASPGDRAGSRVPRGRGASRPTAAGSRPTSRRLPGGRGSSARRPPGRTSAGTGTAGGRSGPVRRRAPGTRLRASTARSAPVAPAQRAARPG